MGYLIETRLAPKSGWDTPDEARRRYGRYSRDGVTVHWWNTPDKAGTHDQTVEYVLRQAAAGNMSVNYVVSDSKITLLVGPDNVAWHATAGNPTTIGVEFDPRLSAEGYKRGGWLISELEGRYGKSLTLYPHSRWAGTACPGTISLEHLRQEANNSKQQPAQPAQGGSKVVDASDLNYIYQYGPLGRPRGAREGEDVYLGKTASFVIDDHLKSKEYAVRKKREADAAVSTAKKIADQAGTILTLQSQLDAKPPTGVGDPQDTVDAAKYRQIREALK